MARLVLLVQKLKISQQLPATLLLSALSCGVAWSQASITKATIFKQIDKGSSLGFVVKIEGSNLTTPENPRVLLLPSTGITQQDPPTYSATSITMAFTAASSYVPVEVTLSYSTGPVPKAVSGTECASDVDVSKSYQVEPENQVAKKYGHGVSKNFDVVQISIVNTCPVAVLVPLAGIDLPSSTTTPPLHPFSLSHVTSIFSNDRTFSGPRAIFFNAVQAAATLGSAIEPFFGSGFTQAVSILGGGFTQGAGTIWKDLSAEQLQNLTAQSFQATEQISASGGSLQKSVFFPRIAKKVNPTITVWLTASRAAGSQAPASLLTLQVIPVLTVATK